MGSDYSVGLAFDSAGNLLGAEGEDDGGFGPLIPALGQIGAEIEGEIVDEGQLTAVWIDYVFASPEHETETIRRFVFDLIGPAGRAGIAAQSVSPADLMLAQDNLKGLAFHLSERIELMPQTSGVDPTYHYALSIDALGQNCSPPTRRLSAAMACPTESCWCLPFPDRLSSSASPDVIGVQ